MTSDRGVAAYPPAFYREEDPDRLRAFIAEVSLGALVTGGAAGLMATHLPFLVEGDSSQTVLTAHMPRANPQSNEDGIAALLIFQGPHAYVSPGWYETKRQDGRVVPTWNYLIVQVHGSVEIVKDSAWILQQVTRLSAHHESGREEPWKPEDAPSGYIDALLRGLVGIRICVHRLEGRWKINQNHPAANRTGVIGGLRATGSSLAEGVALEMIAQEDLRSRS